MVHMMTIVVQELTIEVTSKEKERVQMTIMDDRDLATIDSGRALITQIAIAH